MSIIRTPASVLIAGLGRSGSRFVRAVQYMAQNGEPIRLAAVADPNADRRDVFAGSSIATFADYANAFDAGHYDIIINSLNEHQHFALFEALAARPQHRARILSEKPLTKTLAEAQAIGQLFPNHAIAVNFVERYSPICGTVRDYIHANNLTVARANFFWGKYRVHDPRPTIGVISEISHPLDLALSLADVQPGTPYAIQIGNAVTSDYAGTSTNTLDTVTVAMRLDSGLLITGTSSFTWAGRDRRLELMLADTTGTITQMLALAFDDPLWDIDHVEGFDLRADGGRAAKVWERRIAENEIPEDAFSVYKLVGFLRHNLATLHDTAPTPHLAYLDQAIYVQRILHDITQASTRSALAALPFNGPGVSTPPPVAPDEHVAHLPDFAHGRLRGHRAQWDNGL